MKIKISYLSLVLGILILLGPIFDLLTGYQLLITGTANSQNVDVVTPGIFYRGLFLVPVFIILSHFLKSRTRLIIYYFGIVFVIGLLLRNFNSDRPELVRDTQRYLKLMLPIIGFTGMLFIGKYFTRNKPNEIYWRMTALYGGLAAFGLLTTDWIGLALKVYRKTNVASAGLIDSQNAAGLVLIVSLPLALFYVFKYRNNGVLWVFIVQALWLAAAFRLNTRAVLVAVPTVIIIHHTNLLLKGYYTRTTFQTLSWLVLVILTAIVGFFILQTWLSRDVGFIIERFELLVEGQFRNRVPFGIFTIKGFNVIQHLFGVGDQTFQTTENDFIDIYGKFGLTTLVPVFLFYGYFFFRILINFLRHRTHATFALLMSISLYMIHGITAGHAFLSSPVNNLIILIYFLSYIELNSLKQNSEIPATNPNHPIEAGPVGVVPTTGKTPLAYDV